jgi:hypothetical protein
MWNRIVRSQTEIGSARVSRAVFGVSPNTSIPFARLGKPKQGYARVLRKKICLSLKTPSFKGIQAHSRQFKPLPPGYIKKQPKMRPSKI